METARLGKLIDGEAGRDAIHIAIAPVVAAEKLYTGQLIGFPNDGDTINVSSRASKLIGIVDPFLPNIVLPGDQFYMLLLPNTITSLRHEWVHPAFGSASASPGQVADEKTAAEKWMRAFADRADIGYETAIRAGRDFIQEGDYYTQYGTDSARDEAYVPGVIQEYWKNYEILTEHKVPETTKTEVPFSCSC